MKPTNKEQLSENMAFINGHYWIPSEHPLAWALEQTHGKRVLEHKFKTPAEFLNRYDEYLQTKPTNKEQLSENMAFINGHYWIPSEHPLAWALEQTHGKRVLEHKFKTPKCGTCVVYAEEYVDAALEDIYQLYVSQQRM
jgi:hypothetical protein